MYKYSKNLKAMNGTVIIKLQNVMQDRTPSGIYKDISYDKHGKMMINAEVVEVSDKGSREIMFELDRGAPRPRDHKGQADPPPVYKYNYQVDHNVQIGDIIYFHYLILESNDNFMWIDGSWKYYKLKINDVFLSIRKHIDGAYFRKGVPYRTVLHNEYVLGKPYWGSDWEELEIGDKKIAGKIDPKTGLVTELKGKPQENRTIITDIGQGIEPYSRNKEVKSGDVCLLKPNCEFVNEIENQERWVFTHSDILAKIKGETFIPVCDMVLIKLKERTYDGNLEVDIDKLPLLDEGWVVSCGDAVDDTMFRAGIEVKFFSHRASFVLEKTHVLVQECNIMGILNYSL